MLDQGEVANRKGHLAIHNAHDTSVHCGPNDLIPGYFSVAVEGLGIQCFCAEEEDDDRTAKPIEHPAQYSAAS